MKKISVSKTEYNILSFLEKRADIIALVAISVLGLIIRLFFIKFETSDYTGFLSPWFEQLKNDGGLMGMANYTGNYNYAYVTVLALLTYLPIRSLYSIKAVSILFDFGCASVGALLGKKAFSGSKRTFTLIYGIVLLSPIVVINSSLWAQCDSVYTFFVLLTIYLFLCEKYSFAMFIFGIAFSFKLQAVFVLPLLILLYLVNKNFSVIHFLMIPAGIIAANIPGFIFSGKGPVGFVKTYIEQIKDPVRMLTQNFPNIYYWISAWHYDLYKKVGIVFTASVFLIVFLIIYGKVKKIENRQIVSMALWSILCCVYFLPNMHERYGYAAELLCIIWAFGHVKWSWYPVVLNTIILFCYFCVIYGYNLFLFQTYSVVNILMFVAFTIYVLIDLTKSAELSDGSKTV